MIKFKYLQYIINKAFEIYLPQNLSAQDELIIKLRINLSQCAEKTFEYVRSNLYF